MPTACVTSSVGRAPVGVAPIGELRAEVASAHGLPPAAVQFLTGTTLAELEASAGKLVKLTGSAPEPEPAEPLAGLFGRAPAEKQQRQRALVAALHGRREQPRDPNTGQWTTPVSFDGGARPLAPAPREPLREHNETLVDLLRTRQAAVARF